jgi:hypothetical protein
MHGRDSDGKWRISKVVQPHTCVDNKEKENHQQLTARYLARCILGLIDKNNQPHHSQPYGHNSGQCQAPKGLAQSWIGHHICT